MCFFYVIAIITDHTMKILLIADRPPEKPILEILATNPVDLIITLGDLESSELRGLDQVTHIPKLGVYGNHCSGMYFDSLGIRNMHMQTFAYRGVTFGGFEGCVRYKESIYAKMYTQDEASELLKSFPHVDVMLSHCPPFGVNDDQSDISHTGFIGLRDYIQREKPKALFHGHTYPTAATLVQKVDSTQIIYVYGSMIYDLI